MACCGSASGASISPNAIARAKEKMKMRRTLQLAVTTLLFAATAARAQIRTPGPPPPQTSSPQIKKDKKPAKENVEWLCQYGPPPAEGRENQLVLDQRFRPFLAKFLPPPQTFWGNPKTGYKSLAEAALDFLSVPDKVVADDN